MLSLYIHVPFCTSKCFYCGFYSTAYEHGLADEVIEAFRLELEISAELTRNREILSVYIGGGTPSSLSVDQADRLFEILKQAVSFSPAIEITFEANPGSVSSGLLQCLHRHGVSRLSIGVQSFFDDDLRALGRGHRAEQARATLQEARRLGFRSLSLDLIYGIPGQDAERWQQNLAAAIAFAPDHLSVYNLTADNGSALADAVGRGDVALPDDERVSSLYETACATLRAAGYRHYEIANFARPGHESRHNLHYWDRGEYLGIGPSATSFIGERRWSNAADVREYVAGLSSGTPRIAYEERLTAKHAAAETVLLGLRTASGIDLGAFADRFSRTERDALILNAAVLEGTGLVCIDDDRMRLTERGMLLSNEVLARVLP